MGDEADARETRLIGQVQHYRRRSEALGAALRDLLADTQHAKHHCGDTAEHCPVRRARELLGLPLEASK